jgi:hypothetical protein
LARATPRSFPKDGRRITTFVKGNVVVRGLDNCDNVFDTGIRAREGGLSWDGRYIAFHALKKTTRLTRSRSSTSRSAPCGRFRAERSALFRLDAGWPPVSGDGPDYRGFMLAKGVLDVAAEPLPAAPQPLPAERTWSRFSRDARRRRASSRSS